ncbi:sodium:solute symporter family protein [bacterium]|jgi:solute:Na+ symporter, SSS family|nr:sodium:solute symporter family protein [bacterium]MDB4679895.1 sodium:solute symporter family protein [Planctomycetaceae bacterium]
MIVLGIIGGYIALLLCLGLFSSRLFKGTSKDFMLASHSIGPFMLLMSLFGTTMTAFALVGSTGEAYVEGAGVYGLLASSSGIIHSLCFFILGVKLWSLGKKYGYTTQIQYFRDRLQSDKIGVLLFPVLVGMVIPYLLIGVMASGTFINAVTRGTFEAGTFPGFLEEGMNGGVPKSVASLIICVVVLIYVFFGGMRGTAWANTFQTCVFMVLGVVTFYVIAMKLGGEETLMASLRKASAAVDADKLTRMHMSKTQFATYFFVPLSVGMFPHLFQHWLTAKSANSFKLPVVAHPFFIMIVWCPCILIGLWASTDLINLPPPIASNPNAILPFMVNKLNGPVMTGLLSAGVLAAIMSSLDSQFLCLGTMFTEDIVVHYGGKGRYSEKQTIMIARAFIIAIVAVVYAFSLFEPRRVFTLGIWCFSGYASLFPLVFASLYWKKLTKAGAYAAVITCAASWVYLFRESGFGSNEKFTVDFKIGGAVYDTMPVMSMFFLTAIVMIVVSLVTPKPTEETLQRFFPEKPAA